MISSKYAERMQADDCAGELDWDTSHRGATLLEQKKYCVLNQGIRNKGQPFIAALQALLDA